MQIHRFWDSAGLWPWCYIQVLPNPTDKTAQDIYADAMKLSKDERDKLSLMLAQENDSFYATPEIEQAWDEEIARRIKLMDEGKMQMYDGDEVMRELRKIASCAK